MERIYPKYYEKFHCIAGDCPDSCCREWDVEVDENSAAYYRALTGEIGALLQKNLYEEDGRIYLAFPEGRCPLQREDGLCRVHAELGEQALCEVCRRFPRLTQDYGNFVELGLEMSCPEAARLILSEDMGALSCEEIPGGSACGYDEEAMSILRRTRPRMLALLTDRSYPVRHRLALALLYAYQVQGELDGAEPEPFDAEGSLRAMQEMVHGGDISAITAFFRDLEILTERWRELLGAPREKPCWFEPLSRFACYGIYRYYYQAVSDYDLTGRVKMVVIGCILAAFLVQDSPESQICTLQLYSKEIENDAENIDAILDGAYTHPALTDRNLLGLLL